MGGRTENGDVEEKRVGRVNKMGNGMGQQSSGMIKPTHGFRLSASSEPWVWINFSEAVNSCKMPRLACKRPPWCPDERWIKVTGWFKNRKLKVKFLRQLHSQRLWRQPSGDPRKVRRQKSQTLEKLQTNNSDTGDKLIDKSGGVFFAGLFGRSKATLA